MLLEDDLKLSAEVRLYLNNRGYHCDVVYDGFSFLKQSNLETYDLYLLDINVPVLDGLQVCKKVRTSGNTTPILMLTAYSDVPDKVQALDSGADDYLVKPFHLEELDARARALLRRSQKPVDEAPDKLVVGDLEIDRRELRVHRAGREITLTPKEYKLLELLARHGGATVSKQTIAEQVWDIHFETGTNTIEVYISFLRNKIDKGFDTPLIHTRPGYGYFLKDNK